MMHFHCSFSDLCTSGSYISSTTADATHSQHHKHILTDRSTVKKKRKRMKKNEKEKKEKRQTKKQELCCM